MRQHVRAVIDETLRALKAKGVISFEAIPTYSVDAPKNPEHGDWACNVAMVMSKAVGKKPAELADAIIANLVDAQSVIVSVEKAGPGFLNLRLKDVVFQRVAREVLSAGVQFGRRPPKSTGRDP